MTQKKVGVIGLGAMGLGIAKTLRNNGYSVHVCDVRPGAADDFAKDGGVACTSPADLAAQVDETKRALLRFLIDAKEQGLRVAGYGAPANGNTLLNYCGVRTDLIDFTVDASPHKQGTWLPGARIPVFAPEKLREAKPDIVLILPWNLKDEIVAAHGYIGEWGGRFAVPIPRVEFVA